jgi:erythronate-4-phosphate dehydrogenase
MLRNILKAGGDVAVPASAAAAGTAGLLLFWISMNIWVDENIPLGKETFGAYGAVTPFAGRGLARADLGKADALLVRSVTKVDAALLEGTPVRFVGTATIGTDHVDLPYLAGRGIGFSSAPGSNANSVAEYVTAALLMLRQEKGFVPEGKTLGIVGWGNVGRQVEKKALALGMRVLRCDPPLRESAEDPGFFTGLPDLLGGSHVVSLHVPLTSGGPHPTRNLADTSFFAKLGGPVVLLNTCRGGVIREEALKAALDGGRVRHLVLDVFAGEPRIDPETAAAADIATPHIAGYSLEGKLNGTAQIAEAFRAFFALPPAPAPAWPRPARPEIAYLGNTAVTQIPDDWDFLRRCVDAAYDLRGDDRRLRASLSEPDPGKAFDRLRREYPVRHEFSAYRITGLPENKRELRTRLGNLGFR